MAASTEQFTHTSNLCSNRLYGTEQSHLKVSKNKPIWLVRKLFGDQHFIVTWLDSLCADKHFLLHLATAQNSYLHFLCLVFLVKDNSLLKSASPGQIVQILRVTPKKILLPKLFSPYPAGLAQILSKCGSDPFPEKKTYEQLLSLMLSNNGGSILRHRKNITVEDIQFLANTDDQFRLSNMLEIFNSKDGSELYKYIIHTCTANGTTNTNQLRQSLARINTNRRSIVQWFYRHMNKSDSWPTPPWNAVPPQITPITNAGELIKIAHLYRNCLKDYIQNIRRGTHYVYSCQIGSTKAIAMLIKDPYAGFMLGEIKGERNETLRPGIERRIVKIFKDAGYERQPSRIESFLGYGFGMIDELGLEALL